MIHHIAVNDEVVAVEAFIDEGNILGKIWVAHSCSLVYGSSAVN